MRLAVFLFVLGFAGIVSAQETDPRRAEALGRITRGEALYEAGNYEGALAEFLDLREYLGDHPLRAFATYNIARCQERLHEYDQAIAQYEAYLEEDGPEGRYAEVVRGRLETLEDLLGTVVVRVTLVGAPARWELWAGERRIGTEVGRVRLPGGEHRLEVRAPGYETVVESRRFAAGETVELEIQLRAAFDGLSAEPFAAAMILGSLFAITTAVLGPIALVRFDELSACRDDPTCRSERWGSLDAANAENTALAASADIALGLTVAAFATAIGLAFFTRFGGSGEGSLSLRPGAVEVAF